MGSNIAKTDPVVLSPEIGLIKRAKYYAEIRHRHQVRRHSNLPYWVHPQEVAHLVSFALHDEAMVAAAWLHDIVEDTFDDPEEGFAEIGEIFGSDVKGLVWGLTDTLTPADGNRDFRKKASRDRIAPLGRRVHTIKLADLISNSRDIMRSDPKFAKKYMAEKKEMLEVLTDGDEYLQLLANAVVEDYYAQSR